MIKTLLTCLISIMLTSCQLSQKPLQSKDLRGQKIELELGVDKWFGEEPDLDGKFVLLDFWRTWCPPCLGNITKLNRFQKKFNQKLVVIGLTNEEQEKVDPVIKVLKANYPMGIDFEDKLKNQFEVLAFPVVVIVDPAGIVRWQGVPSKNWHDLTEEKIAEIIDTYAG